MVRTLLFITSFSSHAPAATATTMTSDSSSSSSSVEKKNPAATESVVCLGEKRERTPTTTTTWPKVINFCGGGDRDDSTTSRLHTFVTREDTDDTNEAATPEFREEKRPYAVVDMDWSRVPVGAASTRIINLRDGLGATPRLVACRSKKIDTEIIATLLTAGADPSIGNSLRPFLKLQRLADAAARLSSRVGLSLPSSSLNVREN